MASLGSIGDKPKPRVVAVILCYNTAPHIAEVVTKAKQYVVDEVILMHDERS